MKISFTGIGKQNEKLTKKLFKKYKKIFNKSEFILRRDVKKFEKNICKFMKSKYCVGLNSGTDALLMGLFASGLKPGDEVITHLTSCNNFCNNSYRLQTYFCRY